jgi:hypothetical protein
MKKRLFGIRGTTDLIAEIIVHKRIIQKIQYFPLGNLLPKYKFSGRIVTIVNIELNF